MLVNNINYLRERYPYIREELKSIEDNEDKKFTVEETRSGDQTLLYKDDEKEIYFHSKYNPIREAEALIEDYREVKGQNIIFYGTGLGYHIDLLMSENPDNNYYIFEPIGEVLEKFLSKKDITGKYYKNLKKLSLGMNNIAEDIKDIVQNNRKEINIIELPTHKQIFENELQLFNEMFLETVKSERSSIGVNFGFQKRWIVNTMKNFSTVLSTPNILIEKSGQFKDKPAILVSAGPSLNQEIENLRHIKENGLAYIFSVGSAINTLIHHDIYPDAITTYDPTDGRFVFDKVTSKGIKDIPMIFGSSVGHETIENYLGEKYHMITSQDPTSSYYLKYKDETEGDKVLDAPSIAVVTVQLLMKLGFSKVMLVGQNLGYVGRDIYSDGIHYRTELTDEEMKNSLKVKDVYGKEMLTSTGYNNMRQQMEAYIKTSENTRIINTTKGGANIEGADFIELEKVIASDLKDSIVEKDWLESSKTSYDKKYLKEKLSKMDIEYEKALKITKEYISTIKRIDGEINNRNIPRLQKLYAKLNKEINSLERNDFYTSFLIPMNRVQYRMAQQNVANINEIKNPLEKGREILKSYAGLISIFNDDLKSLKGIYEDMKEAIENFVEKDLKSVEG